MQAVIDYAEKQITEQQRSRWEVRVDCPLCRRGDWKFPGGLEMHLDYWDSSRTRKCPVMTQLYREAETSLRSMFVAEEKATLAGIEERKTTETLYLIHPDRPPELIDRGYSRDHRSPEDLAKAEQRLFDLGFEKEQKGNIVAYKLWLNDRLILADPRRPRSTEMNISQNPGVYRGKYARLMTKHLHCQDSWREETALRNLAAAVESIPVGKLRPKAIPRPDVITPSHRQ